MSKVIEIVETLKWALEFSRFPFHCLCFIGYVVIDVKSPNSHIFPFGPMTQNIEDLF